MGILDLPNELLLLLAEFLSIKDLSHFLLTCRPLCSLLTPRLNKLGVQVEKGYTALQWAARYNRPTLAELAISRGARVDEMGGGKYSCTALHIAARYNHPGIIRTLAKHGATIDALDTGSKTPLCVAALFECVPTVAVLLELGAVIPLACTHPRVNIPTHVSAYKGDVDCMRAFISAGFDFNIRGFAGKTVLHEAAGAFKEKMMQYLLEQEGGKATINSQDSRGYTPLHSAVRSSVKEEEKVRLLLSYGADSRLKDNRGYTPADWAKRRGLDILNRMLLECGTNGPAQESVSIPPLVESRIPVLAAS